MQFTDQEQAMIAVLRRQRAAWPALRIFMTRLVGVMAASHTFRNWHGPPEASLLLKLIDRSEAGQMPNNSFKPTPLRCLAYFRRRHQFDIH